MPYASLRDFIARLEAEGRLVRVAGPVSPVLEMTEIQIRLLAEGGPAVLFENVVRADGTPYGMPMLVNLFGTLLGIVCFALVALVIWAVAERRRGAMPKHRASRAWPAGKFLAVEWVLITETWY